MTLGTKLGSTRGRPIPSIRDAHPSGNATTDRSSKCRWNTECTGSATHNFVSCRQYRMKRPIVADVPPVPAPHTIQDGHGCSSSAICAKMLSAMLLLPRQSVARSA